MYLRAAHAEPDIATLQAFIHANAFGLLITSLPSPTYPTIQCTHLPFLLSVPPLSPSTPQPLGTLRAHLARANPHAKALIEAAAREGNVLDQEVCIVFNGPAQSYVTPKFYIETKPATGKVVPTWNYSAVQAYGRARLYVDGKDEATGEFLARQVADLTDYSEREVMGHTGGERPEAWTVGDAPVGYVEVLKKAILGVEVTVERLEGKWKMSQELGEGDREGVVRGFLGLETENARRVAETVRERGVKKDKEKEGKAA